MPRKITIHLLCFFMAWSAIMPAHASPTTAVIDATSLRQQYPNAHVIHVDPENYPQFAASLQERGYKLSTVPVQLTRADVHIGATHTTTVSTPVEQGCSGYSTPPPESDTSLQVMVDFSNDMLHHGPDNEGAAIMFIIVGTVLVIAWSLYVFKYLYDVASGFEPCWRWAELALTSSAISTYYGQHADFNGLRYSAGFNNGAADVGIALELGQADIRLNNVDALRLQGHYWLMGPVLRWPLSSGYNPHNLHMNFMAGSTEHHETGFIGKVMLGLRLGLGKNFHLGFDWGALKIRLNEGQGIVTQHKQYHYLYGINMGFQF